MARYGFRELVIDSRTGLNPRTNFTLGEGNNYYITIKDIHDGRVVITDKTDRVNDEAIAIIKKRSRIKNGDILFTSIGRIGETAIVENKDDTWDVNESVFVFTLNRQIITPEYFCIMFQSDDVQDRLMRDSSGSTFKSIKMNQLEKMTFDVPDICTQQKVSGALQKVTHLISLRKQQIAKLDELVKARFVEMFGESAVNPHNYPIQPLSSVAEYFNGLTYKPEDVADTGTIVLRSSNIQNSQLDFEDTVHVSCSIRDRLMVKENDILMCSRNGSAKLVGKVALIKNLAEPMSFGAFMMIIRSTYFPYLMVYFQLPAFRQQIQTGATTTINQITGRMLDEVVLPVPPMERVNQFADFVAQTDQQKLTIQHSLAQLELLKKALMQKYFG